MKTIPEKIETDILIIGGGPAGIQASRMLCASNPKLRVNLVRPEDHSMVYCALPYAIEGLIPLEKTFKKDELVTDSGAKLLRGNVNSVDPDTHLVSLEDGRTVSYGKLLIATGARPSKPPVKGANAENVFTVKTQDDAQRIISRLMMRAECEAFEVSGHSSEKHQKAVVIGAGAIGIEQAMAYSANGLEVHLVEMRDHVLPHLIDADMTEFLDRELAEMGICVHNSTRLESLEGDGQIAEVRLSTGASIPVDPDRDFVVIAVGMTPDIDFLEPSGIERVADGLIVDEHMKTSAQDVWAAGDCVSFYSGIDRKPLGGKLATNAVPMAKVAAKNMMGSPAAYPGFFNGAATVVGKYRIGGTGFTETFAASRGMEVYTSEAVTTARFPMMPDAGYVRVKLVVEKGSHRIVGAQVLGTEAVAERIDLLTFAIQNNISISRLEELSYSAQPWQTFFPARNAIVEAAAIAVAKRQNNGVARQ